MRLASSIADRVLVEYGKVVSLKFVGEEEFNKGKSPLINEIRRGVVVYGGGKR